MQVSRNEYLFMELFWKEKRPLSRAEILKGTAGRDWNPASIHLIINSMLSKKLIKITDEGKKYGRTYESIVTQEEYVRQFVDDCLPGKTNQQKLLDIVTALTNREGVSEKDIEDLEKMLAGKREGLTKKVSKKGKKD